MAQLRDRPEAATRRFDAVLIGAQDGLRVGEHGGGDAKDDVANGELADGLGGGGAIHVSIQPQTAEGVNHKPGGHPISLTFGSLFAGVGGFDLGFESAGWECGWQVEWDKHCQSVLAHHWPHVPKWGDVSTVSGADLPPVDCITFGSPCQDLSVAGKRAGLDGDRSGLFYEAIRIIKEMRDATDDRFPRWAVWENVAGAVSSNGGADFGAVLDTLADAGALVLEWAVLDARWFGVPQRRRRVFVVACFNPATASRCPDPLLPVAARSGWHPPASATAGTHVAALTANGVGTCGADDNQAQAGHLVPYVKARRAQSPDDHETWETDRPAPTLNAFDNATESRATVLAFHMKQTPVTGDVSPSLGTTTGGMGAMTFSAVRRLTPVECERLMGWPDDHTRWRADGTEQADSHRYRQCGNGVASPVAEWVAKQIGTVS